MAAAAEVPYPTSSPNFKHRMAPYMAGSATFEAAASTCDDSEKVDSSSSCVNVAF